MVFRRNSNTGPLGLDTSRVQGSPEINPETQGFSNSEQAFLSIQDVRWDPQEPVRGEDNVEVEVDVVDQSGSSADYVRGYVVIQSELLDSPLIQYGAYLQPGGTMTVNDGDCNGALDGEFFIEEDTRIEVTAGGIPEGVTCDTVHTQGVKTDGKSVRIQTEAPLPPLDTRISEFPDEVTACPGEDTDITIEVANSGDFGAIRLTFTNEDIGQEESFIETAQAAPDPGIVDWTKEYTFTTSLPEGETRGRAKITLEQNPGGRVWTQTGRESISINATEAELFVRNIDGPNSACVGSGGTVTAELYHNAPCPATGKAKLVNDFNSEQFETDQFTIAPGETQPVSFDFELPANANDDIDYEVLGFTLVEGNFEETGDAETTVVAINPELEIIETSVTEFRCVGSPVTVSTVLTNPEICPQEARVILTNNKDEERLVLGPKTLDPQTNARFQTQVELPDNAVLSDEVEYRVDVQTNIGGTWVSSDDDDEEVEIGKAEFEAQSFTMQRFAQPDEEVTGEVIYENAGECPGTLAIENNVAEGFSQEMPPESTATYEYAFTMGSEGQEVDITASYDEANRVQDELAGLVRVHKTVLIDTQNGVLTVTGGFDSPNQYEATIQAEDISGSGLEEEDSVTGILRLARFNGTISTQSTDFDEVTFTGLQYLNMSTSVPTQWVVDGEIQGIAKSFEYRSFSRNPLTRPSDVPASSPEISVRYSPTKRIGTIARGLGRD